MKAYLEFIDGSSAKFWQVETDGNVMTITFGRMGTAGQAQSKEFANPAAAEAEAVKQMNGKIKKGYAAKEGGEVAAPASKAAVAKQPAEPKQTKQAVKGTAPADVTDDGAEKEWQKDSGWGDGFWDAGFWGPEYYADLRTAPAEKAEAPAQPAKKQDAAPAGLHIDRLRDEFTEACADGEFKEAKEAFEKLRPHLGAEALKELLDEGIGQVHEDVYRLELEHIDLIEWLIAEGAVLPAKRKDGHKALVGIANTYIGCGGKKSYREAADEYFRQFYGEIAAKADELTHRAVRNMKEGAYKEKKMVDGTRLSADAFGFRYDIDCDEIEVRVFGSMSGQKFEEVKLQSKGRLDNDFAEKYFPARMLPYVEKMATEGLFADLTTTGCFAVATERGEVFFRELIDPSANAAAKELLEKRIVTLEAFIGDEEVTEVELNPTVLSYLANGCDPTGERCLKLLKANLYCGNPDVERKAYDTLNEARKLGDWDAPYLYEKAIYNYRDFNFGRFEKEMRELVDKFGYESAKERLAEWAKEEPLLDYKAEDAKDDEEDNEPECGRGEKKTLPEEVLFRETDTMIARADHSGRINVRFKIEGKQGYDDVLDYLIALMEAGYSRIHDGYEMGVYFLAKPAVPKLGEEIPRMPETALFMTAAMWEELHPKIRRFVDLTVHLYDHYHNLDGEWSTPAGTFAVIGACLHDPLFMDLAVRLAKETDGEHEEVPARFVKVVEKRWGCTPQTAVALFELNASTDGDTLFKLKDLFCTAANAAAFLQHYNETFDPKYSPRKLAAWVVDQGSVRSLLKRFKEYYAGADNDSDKTVWADLHNLILETMEEKDGESYGQPLSLSEAQAASAVEIERFEESSPVIIPAAEAAKRSGTDIDEMSSVEGRAMFVFRPSAITNPYIYDFVRTTRDNMSSVSKICDTYTCSSADYLELLCNRKWAFDLRGAARRHGMVFCDGKNKPVVLYGLFDYAAFVRKAGKKSSTDLASLEALRVELLKMKAPAGAPTPAAGIASKDDLLGNALEALYHGQHSAAMILLDRVGKDSPDYAASLLIRADLMKVRKDRLALKAIYAELLTLLPEYTDYWNGWLAKLK